jgi:HK97 gp10 family phage protein
VTSKVRIDVRDHEVAQLLADPALPGLLMQAARPIVASAKQKAPRRTGGGAGSIRAEPVLVRNEWQVLISWDRLHFYMYFQHEGTRQISPRPFLEDAVREAAL